MIMFENDTEAIERYIMTMTNSMALTYNSKPMSLVARFHFVVNSIEMVDPKLTNVIREHANGDIYRMKVFRHYVNKIQEIFAGAILLTAHNFLHSTNKTDTQGKRF